MAGQADVSLIVGYGTDMGNAEDAAMSFAEAVADIGITAEAERLEHLNFSVLALGDTSYEFFCNAGKLVDERLEALGATRLLDCVDIDGHYEQAAAPKHTSPDRIHPFEARLAVNRRLNSPASDKEVRHYEVDLTGSAIVYRAGDSIAVHATNDPALVEEFLAELGDGADGDPKAYVQQCMWENSAQLFGWLQDGAYLYVCGDAERMAKDVDATLHDIVARCGGMGAAAAHAFVNDLIKSHRYVRDVF